MVFSFSIHPNLNQVIAIGYINNVDVAHVAQRCLGFRATINPLTLLRHNQYKVDFVPC